MTVSVGIEKIAVYPCTLSMEMATLVAARGGNVDEVCGAMMIRERSLNPPWEDPVTMAVNAARAMLMDADRAEVKLLLVGSESGLDQEKALSTWVHRFLELPDHCRTLETKGACYAGTASLRLACAMVMADPDPDSKALVITSDESRAHFNQPYEFVMGAGAVAMLVSKTPDFLALDSELSGVYAHEVADLIRPTSQVEAGHSETSLLSYLDAADLTFDRYREAVHAARGVSLDSLAALGKWLPTQVYHAPFGGITMRAHRAVLRLLENYSNAGAAQDFKKRVAPSLTVNARMGGTYASSVFISLMTTARNLGARAAGQRCGIYSYGSGSCAEFFSGVFGSSAGVDPGPALAARKSLSVAQYEEAESARAGQVDQGEFETPLDGLEGWYGDRYDGAGLLTFRGAGDFVRDYRWS